MNGELFLTEEESVGIMAQKGWVRLRTLKPIIFFVLCLTLSSFAHSVELLFGPEFTFTTCDFSNGPHSIDTSFRKHLLPPLCDDGAKKWQYNLTAWAFHHLVEGQPRGAEFEPDLSNTISRFRSPNGWSFTITKDPGVIEVRMSPMTAHRYRLFAQDIQDAIFASANNIGLIPWDYLGGGHINIGLLELYDHPLLLRNFIVDFYNHPSLSMGIFNYDTNNALPLQMLQPGILERFLRVIAQFDRNYYQETESFLFDLYKNLHISKGDPYKKHWKNSNEGRYKHVALSFVSFGGTNIESETRMEVRSVRPQKSMDVFVRQIELLQGRMDYLSHFSEPIPLRTEFPLQEHSPEIHAEQPPIEAQTALQEFYVYVKQSGKNWQDHRDYLWPQWVKDGELEKFEKSQFFIENERKNLTERNKCGQVIATF